MPVAREQAVVALPPDRAMELWLDPRRWPTWVDGFGHVSECADGWPAEPGAKVVWRSRPGGRGLVTERVVACDAPHSFVADVFEERLIGRQTVTFGPAGEGSAVSVELDYRLTKTGPLQAIADVFFIRPRLRESQRRALRRFATEAGEEAALHRL